MILWLAVAALAAGVESRTGREPLPARELERPVVLPRGWSAVDTTVAWKHATGWWGRTGGRVEGAPRWRTTTATLGLRHGLTRTVELGASVPWEWGALGQQHMRAVGDPELSARWLVAHSEPPARSLAVEARHRAAFGHTPFGAGGAVWSLGVVSRVRLGGLRIGADVHAERWTASRVRTVPPSLRGGGPYWVKPGDQWVVASEWLYQAGPLFVAATPEVARRGPLRVGRGPTLFPAEDYLPEHGPGAWLVDLGLTWGAQLSRGAAAVGGVSWPLAGQGRAFFPTEAIHPTRGRTWYAGVEWRL
jgi:hypothetical protein